MAREKIIFSLCIQLSYNCLHLSVFMGYRHELVEKIITIKS
jgi:hypothetical protein